LFCAPALGTTSWVICPAQKGVRRQPLAELDYKAHRQSFKTGESGEKQPQEPAERYLNVKKKRTGKDENIPRKRGGN